MNFAVSAELNDGSPSQREWALPTITGVSHRSGRAVPRRVSCSAASRLSLSSVIDCPSLLPLETTPSRRILCASTWA